MQSTYLQKLITRLQVFTRAMRIRLAQQTHLRAFGTGKIEFNGNHYNVIFYITYQAHKNRYTVNDIEKEASNRFNLTKCRVLQVTDIGANLMLSTTVTQIPAKELLQPMVDKIQYLELAYAN